MKAFRSNRLKGLLADPVARKSLRSALAQPETTIIRQNSVGGHKIGLRLKFVPIKDAA
jgi:hypothetical protein